MKPGYPRIKARLLIDPIHPSVGYPIAAMQADPADPTASAEDRNVWLVGDDWRIALSQACLEDVTEEDVRAAMNLPTNKQLFLAPARLLPDHPWVSNEMLAWTDAWCTEALTERKNALLARAS
jgi:hypothetical protein